MISIMCVTNGLFMKAKIRMENEPKVGLTNVLAEDLKNLMYVKDERGFTNDEEDLPPLLQVSIFKRLQICGVTLL